MKIQEQITWLWVYDVDKLGLGSQQEESSLASTSSTLSSLFREDSKVTQKLKHLSQKQAGGYLG